MRSACPSVVKPPITDKQLTVSGEIAPASKPLATSRARKGLGQAATGATLGALLLRLCILNWWRGCVHWWLGVCRVVRRGVVAVLNQRHLLVQLRGRRIAHARSEAVHALRRIGGGVDGGRSLR